MNKMHVYHISDEYLGDNVILSPRIPRGMLKEDNYTERICVCPTIIGCVRALDLPSSIGGINDGQMHTIYLYETDVDVDLIYQPTPDEVPDVYYTGELWIIYKTMFTLSKKLNICKTIDFPHTCYSRYNVCSDDEYMIIDKVTADVVYGDDQYNFSFIGRNPLRIPEAIDYANKNMK